MGVKTAMTTIGRGGIFGIHGESVLIKTDVN